MEYDTHISDDLNRLALLKNVVFRKLYLLPSSGRNVKRILLGILGKGKAIPYRPGQAMSVPGS